MSGPLFKLCKTVVACSLLFTASAVNAVQGPLRKGRYEGTATNTTRAVRVHGDAVVTITEVDHVSRKVKVSMSFSNGLCGEGESSGSLDRGAIRLFGRLTSHNPTCGDLSSEMITNCKVGNNTLSCEYWLRTKAGSSFRDQKGTLEVTRRDLPISAGSESARTPADSAARSSPKDPTPLSGEEDQGVDLALVTATKANLRTGPGASNAVLMEVEQGENLVLIDRQPEGSWYNVIHVGSGSEGWIHASVIKLFYTSKKGSTPVFRAEQIDSYSAPVVEVHNQSNKVLNLRVGSAIYNIPANSSRTVSLAAGAYKYYGSAPGVTPAIGERTFETGYKYTWTFWIVTK
jgi:hypothetical protein